MYLLYDFIIPKILYKKLQHIYKLKLQMFNWNTTMAKVHFYIVSLVINYLFWSA